MADFIDNWLEIQKASGTVRRAHDYWVLGQGAEPPPRRWSVLRDVFGWQGGRGAADVGRNGRRD
jgi:hypothetical protein